MFFLICNRIDCYITINTFEHAVFDLSDTPYSSTFPHKFTFYRVFARKKLNWEFPVFHARSIMLPKKKLIAPRQSTWRLKGETGQVEQVVRLVPQNISGVV